MSQNRTRVAIVTGASRGIGAATAARLAGDGYAVALAARSEGALRAVAESIESAGGSALVVPTDAAQVDQLSQLVDTTVQRFGRLDVLINNAGVLPTAKRSEQCSLEDFEAIIGLNLRAPWWLASRAKEAMTLTGDNGAIVNVTSTAAAFASRGLSLYNASKAGLSHLTRSLALEWARSGIRVINVAPGKTDTVLVKPIVDYYEKRQRPLNPLGRMAEPVEVAKLISYLVSEDAACITGSTVTIDGGEVLAPDNA